MRIRSMHLGEIEGREEDVLHIPEGVIGFEGRQDFLRVDDPEIWPFVWLVATEDPDLAFAVTDPAHILHEPYELTIGEPEREALDLQESDCVEVLLLLSPTEAPGRFTANLKGPLVVNLRNRRAKQLLLYSARLPLRHPVRRCDPARWGSEGGRAIVRMAGRRAA